MSICFAACASASGTAIVETENTGTLLDVYRESGMLAGGDAFPAVATLVSLAGPADSTLLLVGLSLPNRALRFVREGTGFLAEYGVALDIVAMDSVLRRRDEWRETVRVASFAETTRSDESIIFQQSMVVAPGRYRIELTAGDRNSARGFRATDTVDVPAFGMGRRTLSSPVAVYQAEGRTSADLMPGLILNPRSTVAYGAEAPRIYVESYTPDSVPVALRILDAANAIVWETTIPLDSGVESLRHATIVIPVDDLPVGRLAIETQRAGEPPERVPLLVTVSDQWMVANFDEVLRFLSYIATDDEIDSLRAGDARERRAHWERFWELRDPLPATTENEFRQEFFARIRTATLRFSVPGGQPGWQTARGEVYIVLGPPDQILARDPASAYAGGEAYALEWLYESVAGRRLSLLFRDRTGFGRYELDPSSHVAFRAAAERLKPSDRR